MAAEDVQLVREVFGDEGAAVGTEIDMGELFADPETAARLDRVVDADAVVEFPTPDGLVIGGMAGPFRGPGGLLAGWNEWLGPWESFMFRPTEWIDAGGGRVLLLGDSTGRLAGSTLEVDTHVAALWTIRNARIVEIQHFLDQDQARRAAGL